MCALQFAGKLDGENVKNKTVFVISFICMAISILFSFFILWMPFAALKDEKNLIYSSDGEVGKLYEIKEFVFNDAVGDVTDGKNFVIETKEDIVIKEIKKESIGEFRLTAYCSCEKCCGEWALNRPKDENGKDIVYGSTGAILAAGASIAVDPSVIPYGSQVEINGHTYTAHDTGGAIKGNRIDVYFDNHQDALSFGVQYAEVFLIGGEQ